MQLFVKRILWAGVITLAVWVLIILYWRRSMHMPNASDVVLYLFMTPMLLLSTIFIVKKVAGGLLTFATAAPQPGIPMNAKNVNKHGSEVEQQWSMALVFSAVCSRYGNVHDLTLSIMDSKTRFDLDTALVDAHGFPILSGRIDHLEESVYARFEQWENTEKIKNVWEAADQRTIVMAHAVLMDLLQELLITDSLSALMTKGLNEGNRHEWPVINIVNMWPIHWSEAQKLSLAQWFSHLLIEQAWPAEKINISPLNSLLMADALSMLDRINLQINRQAIGALHILIASQSNLDDKTIDEWQSAGWLRTAQNKGGRIAGEGAAGLVLADVEFARQLRPAAMVQVRRAVQRKRNKSADESAKITPDQLIETVTEALAVANLQPQDIKKISADTDSRVTRLSELFETMSALMPELDPSSEAFKVEVECGYIGKTSGLMAVLLGANQVFENEVPVLCICNNDSFDRSALVLNIGPKPTNAENILAL